MKEIDYDRLEELRRESEDTLYHSWYSDNYSDLKKEFYRQMLKNTPEGIKYEGEIIEEQDIDEYYPDEFEEYAKEEFKFWGDNR